MARAPKNEAFGDFGLRMARGLTARDGAVAVVLALAVWALGAGLTTAWLAARLGHQPALGDPLSFLGTRPIYAPTASLLWMERLPTSAEGQALAARARHGHELSCCAALISGLALLASRRRRALNRATELHGSARWAERRDVERGGLLSAQGVIVGAWHDPVARLIRYLRHDGPEHVLALAPTGSGKGVGLVLPTLLSWRESALVLDPKGENFALTSGYRASLGQRIYKLDLGASPEATAAFNPLDAIRTGTPQETADAQRLARMIVDPDGKQFEGPNKHWAETGSALLAATILHVLHARRLQDEGASLRDVLDTLTDRRKTHREVLLDWCTYSHDPRLTQGWSDEGRPSATHPVVAATAREQLNREEKERSAVLSSAVTPLSLFHDELLALNTSHSDFRIEDLMDADVPVTVYLVLRPDDIQRLRAVIRIFLDLSLRRLVEKMSFAGGQAIASHKHRLLLMLDEFPILGKLDVFSEALAYIRGWGIKAYLITQDYEQLRNAYGDRETISSNCHLKLAYAPTKPETAKYLSTMLGNATVTRHSRSRGTAIGPFASARSNESEQEVSRPLLTPDECMRLPGAIKDGTRIVESGDMLIFAAGHRPIYGKQPLYFQDPMLLERARLESAPPRPDTDEEDGQSRAETSDPATSDVEQGQRRTLARPARDASSNGAEGRATATPKIEVDALRADPDFAALMSLSAVDADLPSEDLP